MERPFDVQRLMAAPRISWTLSETACTSSPSERNPAARTTSFTFEPTTSRLFTLAVIRCPLARLDWLAPVPPGAGESERVAR